MSIPFLLRVVFACIPGLLRHSKRVFFCYIRRMINLIKDNGESTPFDEARFRESLMKSGASRIQVDAVLEEIKLKLYDGLRTRELYQWAHALLGQQSNAYAARYSLKKALMELGPAGYYFEKWIAKFLEQMGYRALHSKHIVGHAVTHEADVIAEREGELVWIECKFRNTGESKISVTTPMYVLSRVKDISNKKYVFWDKEMEFTRGMLVTNSYFTQDSIDFSEYYGLELLSWDYPRGASLKNLIDQKALYPITCLTCLNKGQKEELLSKNILLVQELEGKLDALPWANRQDLREEIRDLLTLSD